MSQTFATGKELTTAHEGSYIFFGAGAGNDELPAKKAWCYKLYNVWADGGISVRRHGTPSFIRPKFIAPNKLTQPVMVLSSAEFMDLPD